MRRIVLMVVLAGCQGEPAKKSEKPQPRTIAGQLAEEAASRPAGARRVEDVLAAIGRAGVALEAQRQYVARTVAASYCAGSQTAAGLAVSVCEYADEAAARNGKAIMERRFPMPHREIVVRGRNTVTVVAVPGTEADHARVRQTLEAVL